MGRSAARRAVVETRPARGSMIDGLGSGSADGGPGGTGQAGGYELTPRVLDLGMSYVLSRGLWEVARYVQYFKDTKPAAGT